MLCFLTCSLQRKACSCSSRSSPHYESFRIIHYLTCCLPTQELAVYINYLTYSSISFVQRKQKLKIVCYDLNFTGTAFLSRHLYISAGISWSMWKNIQYTEETAHNVVNILFFSVSAAIKATCIKNRWGYHKLLHQIFSIRIFFRKNIVI